MTAKSVRSQPRRRFLRLAITAAVAAGVLLVSGGRTGSGMLGQRLEELSAHPPAGGDAAGIPASLINVKVYYSMMAQYSGLGEENFVLQPPITIQGLIRACTMRHPSLAQMTGNMLILVDGEPAKPAAQLRDGDTVQFIPLSFGG